MVRSHLEPMGIRVGADKAELTDSPLQLAHAVHSLGGIDSSQTLETLWIFTHNIRDDLIVQLPVGGMSFTALSRRGNECHLDPFAVHALDVLLDRKTL